VLSLVSARFSIIGLSFILKFGLDPIYILWDITIFIFCRFGLKLPIHAHWGELEAYFPQMWSPIVLTPERTILAQKHVVWAIKCENRSSGSTRAQDREKYANRVSGYCNSETMLQIRRMCFSNWLKMHKVIITVRHSCVVKNWWSNCNILQLSCFVR